jgi:hypothetical protein
MIWGACVAAGAKAYDLFGSGAKAESMAIHVAQKLLESFRFQNSTTNCVDITDLDEQSSTKQMLTHFLLRGGTIHCLRMATKYAPVAFDDINSVLSEEPPDVPARPVSCAAELARKMGASEKHAVMAAGLAGGIGLNGGACGALGAAIWISSLNSIEGDGNKIDFKNPEAMEILDRFAQSTEYEFECSKIGGRIFENVQDHADYLRSGGCSNVLESLANDERM